MRLIDVRTKDGSREFVRLAGCGGRTALREVVRQLDAAEIINFSEEDHATSWLVFTCWGYEFSARDEDGKIAMIVRDPQCPDVRLFQMAWHCEKHLPAKCCDPAPGDRRRVLGIAY